MAVLWSQMSKPKKDVPPGPESPKARERIYPRLTPEQQEISIRESEKTQKALREWVRQQEASWPVKEPPTKMIQ
jgi:hypothetical protein